MPTQNKAQDSKNKRSVKLERGERARIKKYAKSFDTLQEAADSIPVHRNTLSDVISRGTCHPDTKEAILSKIQAA